MDAQVAALHTVLKKSHAPSEQKVAALSEVKSSIKHSRVSEGLVPTIVECLRLALAQQTSSTLALSAFSTLGHLIKRLKLQDGERIIDQLAPRLLPVTQERLGDLKQPLRSAASHALAELYPFLTADVEHIIREEAIAGTNPRAKEAGIQWVVRMHKEAAMPFKSYVGSLVARVEDSDGTVRDAARTALVELFRAAPDRAKTDLKRQLKAHGVRHSIETQILAQIGGTAASRPATAKAEGGGEELAASTRSLPAMDHAASFAASINSEAAQPPPPEGVPMDPFYVHSQRELEDIFRDMLPHFEGKEDEHNWTLRDKSVMKIRRILKGNAPNEYHVAFLAGIKSVLDGILKVANSLRTTMSTNGAQLVQELARTLGPALDPNAEILLQNFIRMSAQTKPIAAQNGRVTVEAIFQNCSYHARMMQHIWAAAQDKNASTRQCAPEWLRIVLRRQAGYKSHFESSGGLDLAEKTIKKGMDDAKPTVKEGMRATFWTFARTWPERADKIMASLDEKSKSALQRDSHNPNASLHVSQSAAAPTARPGGNSRMALREMMAEQRKAKAAGGLPDRPNSAMATMTPSKSKSHGNLGASRGVSQLRNESRVVSTASAVTEAASDAKAPTGKGRSALMSGPVRRPRRPEITRPQTADPYAARRMLRPETPANDSPANSPPKGTANSKASVPPSSAARNRARTAGTSRITSPGGSPVKRSPALTHGHPPPADARPSSKGSMTGREDLTAGREDDFTMVMPASRSLASSSRVPNGLGHKRPGLGQTMSVDSGIPTSTEEDGFTMVMPNLNSHAPRARSPLAYRSPLKAMFDEARDKLERSASPPREQINSIEEALDNNVLPPPRQDSPIKPRSPQPGEEIQIYEDPFTGAGSEAAPNGERKVLGELQVNENIRVQSPAQSQGSSGSPTGSPRHIPEPARSPAAPTAQDRAEILRNRRLLASGIDKIRTRALDAHGFRRVQDLAKSPLDIWDGGAKYDELLSALLEYLQRFDQDPKLAAQPAQKSAGLKAQALGLIRALMMLQRKSAAGWHATVLVTLYICRASVEASSHLLTDLDKTLDDTLRHCRPEACIDSALAFLPASPAPRSTALALSTVRRLLESAQARSIDLGSERKIRLTAAAAKFLDDRDADVRKADIELASELFELFGQSKEGFWGEFRGTDEGRLGLLTYYIAKRSRGEGAGVGVQ